MRPRPPARRGGELIGHHRGIRHDPLDGPATKRRGVGIHLRHAAAGGVVGRLGEADDEVRLLAQPRVVEAARALHRERRHPGRLAQALDRGGPRAARHGGAQEHERSLRRREQREHPLHALGRRRRGRLVPRRARGRAVAHLGLEQIAGQAHVDGAGPPAPRQLERGGDVLAEPTRVLGHPRGLRHRRGHRSLVHLLEPAAPELTQRGVAAQQHQRRLGHQRGVERGDRVAVAGPGSDEGHRGLVGEAAPRVRHVHGRRLVARVQDGEPAAEGGVVEREDVVAGEREEVADASRLERLHHQVRAGARHGRRRGLSAPARAPRPATPPRPRPVAPRRPRPPCW